MLPTPENEAMLRVARLLLVGSATAAIGVIAVIVSRASAFSPLLLIFIAAAVLFVVAAAAVERDPRRGRLLAVAGASALAGMGILAGFGAGDVTFPAGALGVLAAWATVMWRSPRWVWLAFIAYLAIAAALALLRMQGPPASPMLLASVLLWPFTTLLFTSAGLVAIYGAFGLAIALAVAAYAPPMMVSSPTAWRVIARDATACGIAFMLLEVALAMARPNTSARHELVPIALVVMFIAAALLAGGVRLQRSNLASGLAATVIGGALVLYIATARPTIECARNGVSTTSGPWWSPSFAATSSSGSSVGADTATGRIERGDGLTITYRCAGSELAEFEIQR